MVQARAVVALVLLTALSLAVALILYPKLNRAHRLTITHFTYDPGEIHITVGVEGGPYRLKALIVNCNGSVMSIPLYKTVKDVISFSMKTNISIRKGCLISIVAEDGTWTSFREG